MSERDPIIDPREDDWLTCKEGDIRIDRVHGGWVYFVAWKGNEFVGTPKRMTLANWTEAAKAKRLKVRDEP